MFKFSYIQARLVLVPFFTTFVMTPLSANAVEKHISYDYAPVLGVEPVSRVEKHSTPYQDCWTEQVRIDDYYPPDSGNFSYSDALFGQNSYTGTILGGLVGGGIGHALGHRKANKKAGAIAGGLLGGAIGYDLTRNRRPDQNHYEARPRYESQQRCTTRYETYEEEKIIGYQVRYRYNGHVFSTRTKHNPGDSLRMKIVATPMED